MKNVCPSFVDQPGFEPRQAVPKTAVLPLHHWSFSNAVQRYNIFKYDFINRLKKIFFR